MPPIPTNRPISGLRVVPKLSESESSSFDFGFCFAAHSYDIMYPNQTNKLKVNAILKIRKILKNSYTYVRVG